MAGGINLFAYARNQPTVKIDPFGLTQQDIDAAVKVVKETQGDLNFPKIIDSSMESDDDAGVYNAITDTIRINNDYLEELNDQQASDLLDTIIHETLHANDPIWKQILDTFRDHPDIYEEAERRTKEVLEIYLKERKKEPCDQ